MLSAIRTAPTAAARRAFSTSAARAHDVSKLTLIGRLGSDPQVKTTKNGKEYINYTVATTNYPPPPPNPDGSRSSAATTWHSVYSFHPSANNYLRTLSKGSRVFVEANFEMREPQAAADADSPAGQRQVFLRHESIRLIQGPTSGNQKGEQETDE